MALTIGHVAPEGGDTVFLEVENQPSGLGLLPDRSLLGDSMKDYRLLQVSLGELSTHACPPDVCSRHLNDMVFNAQGRGLVGDFRFDLMGGGPTRSASA